MTIFVGLIAISAAAQSSVEIVLAGHNQVPPVRSPGTGMVELTVEGDSLFVSGKFEDLREYYLGASIHFGRANETGNQIYRLTAELNEEKTGGVFKPEENRFELREAQKEALRNGRMYINIRSNRNRSGEIRGQIPPLSF
ncbi:CHRD domain-containing protein [Rhodohalobacter halophilus]|uniref:CHRD domain-containing protein n=1 Tax=Rhodohalobacter halophilus TaxID=1812810 RepID=UPI0015B66E35|nr:CHRD domain-containing protein [Rhodohalobacter halophilus]